MQVELEADRLQARLDGHLTELTAINARMDARKSARGQLEEASRCLRRSMKFIRALDHRIEFHLRRAETEVADAAGDLDERQARRVADTVAVIEDTLAVRRALADPLQAKLSEAAETSRARIAELRPEVRPRRRGRRRDETPRDLRLRIIWRDRMRCSYCGREGTEHRGPDFRLWEIDHVVPLSAGGLTREDNLVLSCATCNGQKGDWPVEDFLAYRDEVQR